MKYEISCASFYEKKSNHTTLTHAGIADELIINAGIHAPIIRIIPPLSIAQSCLTTLAGAARLAHK